MDRFRTVLVTAAAGLLVGAVAGLVTGGVTVLRQRYLELGFERLAWLVVGERVEQGALWLLGAGAVVGLVVVLARPRGAWGSRLRAGARRLSPALPVAAAVVGALLVAGRLVRYGAPGPAATAPPIVLVSIDTLRADRLGCYGYGQATSPVLDAFAGEGVLVDPCCVQAPWTLTSHMSMLTSLYPGRHGVQSDRALAAREATLAEILRDAGYETRGYVRSCLWMDARYGFDQGFERYVVGDFDQDAAVQTRSVLEDLDGRDGRPLFLFLHYFDVHSDFRRLPYESPPAYRERFAGWYGGDFEGGDGERWASDYLKHLNHEGIQLPAAERAYISSLYDAGLAYLDHCLAELFAGLRDLGLYDDALIVVTSDHGEEFQEHGYLGHGNPRHHLELLRVPLLIRLPGGARAGARVESVVESVDILPTILEEAGVPPPPGLQGRSFAPLLRGGTRPDGAGRRVAFSDAGRSVSVYDGRWHLITDRLRDPAHYRLYDGAADPGETMDMRDERPEIVAELKLVIQERIAGRDHARRQPPVVLDDEDRRRLRALGY